MGETRQLTTSDSFVTMDVGDNFNEPLYTTGAFRERKETIFSKYLYNVNRKVIIVASISVVCFILSFILFISSLVLFNSQNENPPRSEALLGWSVTVTKVNGQGFRPGGILVSGNNFGDAFNTTACNTGMKQVITPKDSAGQGQVQITINPPQIQNITMMSGQMTGWTTPPSSIQWVPSRDGDRPQHAVQAGLNSDVEVFVCRADHNRGTVPGKLIMGQKYAHIAFGGKELFKKEYEVLIAPIASLSWIDGEDAIIPSDAVIGGVDPTSNENSYIGRVLYNGSITVGKVQPGHKTCYFSYDGKEYSNTKYEILVRNALGRAMNV